MKTTLLALAALLALLPTFRARAQAPAWQTALALGTPAGSRSEISAIVVDSQGNVFMTGLFGGTATFGTTTLTSSGQLDVFVAKWHPTTGFIWAHRAGGIGSDAPGALTVNGNSVYVTGAMGGPTATFGTSTLTNSGLSDVFVAKLTDTGNSSTWQWAQRAGGNSTDSGLALAASGNNVYVAGAFASGNCIFGSTTLVHAGSPTNGRDDLFVAKLTDAGSTGSWSWAQQVGDTLGEAPSALVMNGNSLYLTGYFAGPTLTFGATTLTSADPANVFIAKMTDTGSAGAWAWAQKTSGTVEADVRSLAVSGNSVYIAGSFTSPTLGFGNITLTRTSAANGFVAKLTDTGSAGNWTWGQQTGGSGVGAIRGIRASADSLYVAGLFDGSDMTCGATTLSSAGSNDVFVAKLLDGGSNSTWMWAQQAGGSLSENATSLGINGRHLYVAGRFRSPVANFGPISISNVTGGTTPSYAGFLASLSVSPLATPKELATSTVNLSPNPARDVSILTGSVPGTNYALHDALGRMVLTTMADAQGATVFSVRGLPTGLYVVRGAGWTRRLVVE